MSTMSVRSGWNSAMPSLHLRFLRNFAAEHLLNHFDEILAGKRNRLPQGSEPADYLFRSRAANCFMAFSLSHHSLSRALGRNGGPFVLFGLIVLVISIILVELIWQDFVPRHNCSPSTRNAIERDNLVCITF
jgi:hypothetical protein